jgi:hypothetical protein
LVCGIGHVAQIEQPWLAALCNLLFPVIPESVKMKQLDFLYRVKLEGLI